MRRHHLNRLIVAVVTISTALTLSAAALDTYPKRETRAIWLQTVWAHDWPTTQTGSSRMAAQKSEMTTLLTNCKNYGINTVFFQVRSMCDAMYASSYEPWNVYLTGNRGGNPGWDPLAYCIEQCHARGMQCYAWINPFRFASSESAYNNYNTSSDQALKNAGWLIHCAPTGGSNETYILNPANASAMYRIRNVCKEIARYANIDGIIFDDYFYINGIPSDSSAPDYSDYETYVSGGGTLSIAEWRRNNINNLIGNVYAEIKAIDPSIVFAVGPAGVANKGYQLHESQLQGLGYAYQSDGTSISWGFQEEGIFSDPCAWVLSRSIDMISPQLYWPSYSSGQPFPTYTTWWNLLAHVYGNGIRCYSSTTTNSSSYGIYSASEYVSEVNAARAASLDNNSGIVFFPSSDIRDNTGSVASTLKSELFQKKSLPPAINYGTSGSSTPSAPSSLTVNSSRLSWPSVSNSYHYAVYQIPLSVTYAAALSSDHADEIKADYLQEIVYNDAASATVSYSMTTNTSSYWYAVTSIDHYGNEGMAVMSSNHPATDPVSITLSAPADGATVTNSGTFSWTGTSGATFVVKIYSDASLTQLVKTVDAGTATSQNIDITDLNNGATYYWTVTGTKAGYSACTTLARSFVTNITVNYCQARHQSPAIGYQTSGSSQTLTWTGTEGATFVVEISPIRDFSSQVTQVYSGTDTSCSVPLSSLAQSTIYYWRITASKTGYASWRTWENWHFIAPTSTTKLGIPTLYAPANGSNQTSDIIFVALEVGADNYTLEISTDANFSSITYSKGGALSEFETASNGQYVCIQHTVPIYRFNNGTYYWRVRADKSGKTSSQSGVGQFVVSGRPGSPGYNMTVEDADYATYTFNGTKTMFNNQWIRSVSDGNGLGFTGSSTRSFVAHKTDNSDTGTLYIGHWDGYLEKYDAQTGAYIGRLPLSFDNYYSSDYRINNLFVDASNNLCVASMAVGTTSKITIGIVNTSTGSVTTMASMVPGVRCDHCAVYGTVSNSGTYYILAAGSSSTKVLRYTVTNGTVGSPTTYTVSTLSSGAIVHPVSETCYYVTARGNNLWLYDGSLRIATISGALSSLSGVNSFAHNNQKFLIYPEYASVSGSTVSNCRFCVATVNDLTTAGGLTSKWSFPQQTTGSSTVGDHCVFSSHLTWNVSSPLQSPLRDAGGRETTSVYVYVPGEMMAAYTMTDIIITGTDQIVEPPFTISCHGGRIWLSDVADEVKVISPSGLIISQHWNCQSLASPEQSGVYIVVALHDGKITTRKLLINN